MRHIRFFLPRLAGAQFGHRSLAALGAIAGILCAAFAGFGVQHHVPDLPYLIAPIGASAVLVFAVPASPLAQPWPVFGGNLVSGAIAIIVAHAVAQPWLAAGTAVGVAIIVMSLLRCLHPPGGAVAITAILGGKGIAAAGFLSPLTLVAANSAALLCLAWLFHRVTGHSYPHRPAPPPAPLASDAVLRSDIDQAIDEAGESFDIDLADLENLLLRAEAIAEIRQKREASTDYQI